jgi:hypothetical protein
LKHLEGLVFLEDGVTFWWKKVMHCGTFCARGHISTVDDKGPVDEDYNIWKTSPCAQWIDRIFLHCIKIPLGMFFFNNCPISRHSVLEVFPGKSQR